MARKVVRAGKGMRIIRDARYISGGMTWVGVAPEDLEIVQRFYGRRISDYSPFLRVRVASVAMDTCSVTRGEFLRFVFDLDKMTLSPARRLNLEFWKWFKKHVKYDDDLPIVGVTYDEASVFAWFHGGRLPWVYEWELAARGHRGRVLGPTVEQIETIAFDEVLPFEVEVIEQMGFVANRSPSDPWKSPFGINRLVGWTDEWVDGVHYDPTRLLSRDGRQLGYHWESEAIFSRCMKPVGASQKLPHPGLRASSYRESWSYRQQYRHRSVGFRCAYDLYTFVT